MAGHVAELFSILLDAHRTGPQKLLVKVLPHGVDAGEAARHEQALAADAEFAARHLVKQPYPPLRLADGRHLLFLEFANGADRVCALDQLSHDDAVQAMEKVFEALLGWTRKFELSSTTAGRLVRREVTDAKAEHGVRKTAALFGPWKQRADWIRLDPAGPIVPNPLRLLTKRSPLSAMPIDQIVSNCHGDLHPPNILLPCSRRCVIDIARFSLVDIGTFRHDAPVTRDPTYLRLTQLRTHLASLPARQAEALIDLMIDPGAADDRQVLPSLAQVARAGHLAAGKAAGGRGLAKDWRAQYLLTLVGQALVCSTFTNAEPGGQRWYFRLAAQAAEAYRREFAPSVTPPSDGDVPVVFRGKKLPARSAREEAVLARLTEPHRSPDRRIQPPDQARPRRAGARVPAYELPAEFVLPHPAPAPPTPPTGVSTGDGNAARFPVNASAARNGSRTDTLNRRSSRARNRRTSRKAARPADKPLPNRRLARPATSVRRWNSRDLRRLGAALVGVLALCGGFAVWVGRPDETSPTPPVRQAPQEPYSTPSYARSRLLELATAVENLPEPPGEGPLTCVHSRVWSGQNPRASRIDLTTYRDEWLWWDDTRAGKRVVTNVREGRPITTTPFRYGPGDLTTEVPAAPSDNPVVLRRQLTALRNEQPPELQDAAGSLLTIVRILRYNQLTRRQHAALLRQVAELPGIGFRGAYHDRGGRPGLAFFIEDGESRQLTVTVGLEDGRLLSHEVSDDTGGQLSYELHLGTTRTTEQRDGTCH
ncbi:hypothetical protein [Micromonospora rosaria]